MTLEELVQLARETEQKQRLCVHLYRPTFTAWHPWPASWFCVYCGRRISDQPGPAPWEREETFNGGITTP